jgi:hypothetical protein
MRRPQDFHIAAEATLRRRARFQKSGFGVLPDQAKIAVGQERAKLRCPILSLFFWPKGWDDKRSN